MMNGWINVNDRLPETSGEYLVCIRCKYMQIADFFDGFFNYAHVTHWMLLPGLPKEGEE